MHCFPQSKMGSPPENDGKIAIVTGAAVLPLVTVSGLQAYFDS
jgi:hypothetical protein